MVSRIGQSKILAAPASQDRHIELGDMQRALLHLPQPQREALILVGAGGLDARRRPLRFGGRHIAGGDFIRADCLGRALLST